MANPNDPYGIMGRFSQGPAQPKALDPAEQESLLSSLGQHALSGIGYVGATLNKTFGGRAVRGALGGHWDELASPLPFSDTLGVTNPDREVHGEDLLTKWGLIPPNDKNAWELRDFAGPALDLATDPAMYLSFGGSALSEAGVAAKALGTLPEAMTGRIAGFAAGTPELTGLAAKMGVSEAELAGKPLGGVAGLGLPFQHPTALLGTGDVGKAVAGGLGKAWDRAVYSAPGRYASQLFDPNVTMNGVTFGSEAQQRAARAANVALRGTLAGTKEDFLGVAKTLDQGGVLNDKDTLRSVLEGNMSPLPFTPGGQALGQAAADVKGNLAARLKEAQDLGRPIGQLNDPYAEYAPRFRTQLAEESPGYAGYGRELYATRQGSQNPRLDEFYGIRGGTAGVNAMMKDARLAGGPLPPTTFGPPAPGAQSGNLLGNAAIIRNEYLGDWPALGGDPELTRLQQLGPAGRKAEPWVGPTNSPQQTTGADKYDELMGLHKQSLKTAALVAGADPQYAEKGLDYFANHPLGDYLSYGMEADRANATGPAAAPTAKLAGKMQPLTEMAGKAGLEEGAFNTQMLTRLQAAGKLPAGSGVQDLAQFHVGDGLARDVGRYQQALQAPETLQPLVKAWDSITNLTKAGQTSLWPAFHTRNGLTGLFMNWVIGARDPAFSALDPQSWARPFQDAIALRGGGAIAGVADAVYPGAGLSDAEATRKLAEEMFTTGTRTHGKTALVNDVVGRGPQLDPAGGVNSVGSLTLPGTQPEKTILESLGDIAGGPSTAKGTTWNPLKIRGVGGVNEDQFWLGKAGREIGSAVDDVNRTSAYVALRKQGFTAEQAALQSSAAHYDYTKLAPFEREVMRRVIPYYGWMRNNTPMMLKQLLEKPGGEVGASLRLAAAGRQHEGYLPPYVGEGLAIPLGAGTPGADGSQTSRYLSHFGLPFEDAFSELSGGPDALQRTLQKSIAQTNPLIKMPIEMAAGKQMYSGRDLQDLYGPTGTPELDQLLMNSPLSRAYTTGRTLLDERKGISGKLANLVSPGKINDVNIDQQRAVGLKQLLEENLKTNPNVRNFNNLYVRPEDLANLTPDEQKMLQIYKTLEAARVPAPGAAKNIPVKR